MTQNLEPYRLENEINRLRAEVERLKALLASQVVISQKLWAELTPEKRHEINLAEAAKEPKP